MCQHQEYYSVVMDDFTLLDIEGANNGKMKSRVPNALVEITSGCCLTLEWGKIFAVYIISLSKFKSEEQLSFAAKVNIMHSQR